MLLNFSLFIWKSERHVSRERERHLSFHEIQLRVCVFCIYVHISYHTHKGKNKMLLTTHMLYNGGIVSCIFFYQKILVFTAMAVSHTTHVYFFGIQRDTSKFSLNLLHNHFFPLEKKSTLSTLNDECDPNYSFHWAL